MLVDDYREAYFWLRDNTPKDARVMAWWDYGYQIAGMANRTTIADGNTWNHEHIATLGRCLTSPEKDAHRNVRHLADYVLVWAGGGSDDLAKSPHMARIGNSVYDDICPGDPTCQQYGFMQSRYPGGQPEPTPMMAESLLYKLHSAGIAPRRERRPEPLPQRVQLEVRARARARAAPVSPGTKKPARPRPPASLSLSLSHKGTKAACASGRCSA